MPNKYFYLGHLFFVFFYYVLPPIPIRNNPTSHLSYPGGFVSLLTTVHAMNNAVHAYTSRVTRSSFSVQLWFFVVIKPPWGLRGYRDDPSLGHASHAMIHPNVNLSEATPTNSPSRDQANPGPPVEITLPSPSTCHDSMIYGQAMFSGKSTKGQICRKEYTASAYLLR